MRKLITYNFFPFLFLLFTFLEIRAQTNIKKFCGDVDNVNLRSGSYYLNCDPPFVFDSNTTVKQYHIQFYVVRDDSGQGNGNITTADIDYLMVNLNAYFYPWKFSFCYSIEFINDSTYLNINSADQRKAFRSQYVKFTYDEQGVAITNIGSLGLSGDPIYIDYTVVSDSSVIGYLVLAHEIGHNFGLYHSTDPSNLMYPTGSGGTSLDNAQVETIHCSASDTNLYKHAYASMLLYGKKVCNNFGVPYSRFYSDKQGGCMPLAIQFYNSSSFNPTSWLWDFGDGNISTSANPTHVYTSPGIYTVSLITSNQIGADTLTKINYVTVVDTTLSLPYYQDFETQQFPPPYFYIENPDDMLKWESYQEYNGNKCIRMNGYMYIAPRIGSDYITMPPVSFKYTINPYISFRLAYPIHNNFSYDTLNLYASFDCWNSDTLIYSKSNNPDAVYCKIYQDWSCLPIGTVDTFNLLGSYVVDYTSGAYVPLDSSHWRVDSVGNTDTVGINSIDLSFLINKKVQFKFEFKRSGIGNFLYIDDILISADKISGLPVADFTADTTTIYKNDTIHFTNLSNKYSDTLQWFFTGATITTSNDTNPSIVYDSVGTFPVTLVVWNMFGKDTLTKLAYINVLQKIDTVPCDSLKITTSGTNVTCYGKNDGTATISAYRGNSPFTYLWSNGDTARVINNLFAGIYSVTVTDSMNCIATDTVNISEPDSFSIIIISDSTAFNQSTGYIDLTITGGTTPYQYLWSNNDTSQDVDSLPAGNYSVYITDNNSCKDSLSITIYETTSIQNIQFNIQNFNLYPNPHAGTFTIHLELLVPQNIQIIMANLNGQNIYTENIEKAMHYKKNLNLLQQSKGIYTLTLKTPQTTITRQVVYE